MLTDEVWAELLCLIDVRKSCNPFITGRIIDSNQPLPVKDLAF